MLPLNWDSLIGPGVEFYEISALRGRAEYVGELKPPSKRFSCVLTRSMPEVEPERLRTGDLVQHCNQTCCTLSSRRGRQTLHLVSLATGQHWNDLLFFFCREKRALWSWQRARASIASRWCWLQAQLQELEYKIRQHNELHKQVRVISIYLT